MVSSREYTIGQLAAATGLSVRNIRSYRSRGLLQPPRLRGRVGYYDVTHLTRLRLVQALLVRGLRLDVIARHVERGSAQDELMRLSGDEATAPTKAPEMAMATHIVQAMELADPGLVGRMADAGLARRDAGEWLADPALFALANALVASGVSITAAGQVCLVAAEAARPMAERVATDARLRDATTGPAGGGARIVVDLATMAYRTALTSRLAEIAVSAPAP